MTVSQINSTSISETVVVIGAGHAGAQAVDALRAGGFDGRLVLIGDDTHRPYERPPLSKQLLLGEIELERVYLKRESYYAEKRIELMLGVRVAAIDRPARSIVLGDGSRIAYDKIVIATGARARRLDVPGADLDGNFYLRSLADSQAIKARLRPGARLAVIGGGYIGLEVAASAVKFGCRVTVVEMQERLLSRVAAAEIAQFYEREHRSKGVEICYGVAATSFSGAGAVDRVRLTDGDEIAVDLTVIGIGAVPNTELAAAAGLAVENGIVVDDCGRTGDPAIFAAGDATNHPNALLGRRLRLESVPAAMGQARAVASAIRGQPKPFHEIPWFWSDQYDLKLQMAGISEPGDRVVLRGDPRSRRFAAFYLREDVVVAVNAVNSTRDFTGGRRLVADKRTADPARLANPEIPLSDV